MTSEQILNEYAPPALFHGRRWGRWVLDSERLVLVYDAKPATRGNGSGVTEGVAQYTAYIGSYELDLERVSDSAGVLDFIFQVSKKAWASARVTRDLLNALESIFAPQRHLCSGGRSKVIESPATFLRNRFATVGAAA